MSYEMRTYHAAPGKINNLLERFRSHTVALFAEHNIVSVGYWISNSDPNDLIYIVKHLGSPETNWISFKADERWIAVKSASEADGTLVSGIDSIYMSATDFSLEK